MRPTNGARALGDIRRRSIVETTFSVAASRDIAMITAPGPTVAQGK